MRQDIITQHAELNAQVFAVTNLQFHILCFRDLQKLLKDWELCTEFKVLFKLLLDMMCKVG